MNHSYRSQNADMLACPAAGADKTKSQAGSQIPTLSGFAEPDDRYPGTFFRMAGVPMPGKTAWSLTE